METPDYQNHQKPFQGNNTKEINPLIIGQGEMQGKIEQYIKPSINTGDLETETLDENSPRVIIKLGDKKEKHKFILMEDETKIKYLIALPIEDYPYHEDIYKFAKNLYKENLKVVGGGYIQNKNGQFIISGTSDKYGEADKDIVKEIIQTMFKDMKINCLTIEEELKRSKEKDMKEAIDQLDTREKKEFYSGVLENTIKLSNNSTSLPKTISDNKNLFYMIYSCDDAIGYTKPNLRVNTLYIGWEDENKKIKAKAIIKENKHIKIYNIEKRNDKIIIIYKCENGKKTIEIDFTKIHKFNTISHLSQDDEEWLKMYEDMQDIYQNVKIRHGQYE